MMQTVPLTDLSFLDRMSDFRAREIAKAVDAGNKFLCHKWANMKVPEFLALYRAEFKEDTP